MYASRTGTKRNLAELRRYGWRVLVSATGVWRTEGFPYAIDNGAWTYHAKGLPFDGDRFLALVDKLGAGADWVVLPDVVCDAEATAALTDSWLSRLAGRGLRLLAVIQDGATEAQLVRLVGRVYGFFLGGSTEFKVSNIGRWGAFCRANGAYYHVGRVNTATRIHLCTEAGVDSCDGTSATRFASTVRELDMASRQCAMFAPGRA
jgi:hypothetical protein